MRASFLVLFATSCAAALGKASNSTETSVLPLPVSTGAPIEFTSTQVVDGQTTVFTTTLTLGETSIEANSTRTQLASPSGTLVGTGGTTVDAQPTSTTFVNSPGSTLGSPPASVKTVVSGTSITATVSNASASTPTSAPTLLAAKNGAINLSQSTLTLVLAGAGGLAVLAVF